MIIFVRHGQTDDNVNHIISGGARDVSLNSTGEKQAKAVAQKLKDEKIDVCFCSPMLRARQTAQEILKYHKNATFIVDERLRERCFGDFEGVLDSTIKDYWDLNIPNTLEAGGGRIHNRFI